MSVVTLIVIFAFLVGMRVLVTLVGWLATLISIALFIFLLRLIAGWWFNSP